MVFAAFFALRLTAIPEAVGIYFIYFLRKFACGLGFAGGRRRTDDDGRTGRTDRGRRRRTTATDGPDGTDGRTEDDDDGGHDGTTDDDKKINYSLPQAPFHNKIFKNS